jgi:hypothetical protein
MASASKEIVRRPIFKMERASMIGKSISLMKEKHSKIEKTQLFYRDKKNISCEKNGSGSILSRKEAVHL